MLLRLLDKLGRKKIVLDRGPSHPEFHKAKPWMERYYLLFRKRPKWFPFNILIHKMLDDDHGEGVHNHLFPLAIISVVTGFYIQKFISEKLFFNIIYILLFVSGFKLIFDAL